MKTFKDFVTEEPTMTTGADVAGTSKDDPADWAYGKKKKRKTKPLTRHFIEVNGKRKRVAK